MPTIEVNTHPTRPGGASITWGPRAIDGQLISGCIVCAVPGWRNQDGTLAEHWESAHRTSDEQTIIDRLKQPPHEMTAVELVHALAPPLARFDRRTRATREWLARCRELRDVLCGLLDRGVVRSAPRDGDDQTIVIYAAAGA